MSWNDRLVTYRAKREPEDRRAAPAFNRATMRSRLLGAGTAAAVLCTVIAAAGPAAAGVPVKTPAAQPGFRAALEQIVDDGVPGAIGLARHSDQVLIAASGTADIATGQPMAAADRVRVGSIIKTIVATVVLQLVAEHELRLSDSVARWLPGLVPDGRAITLRELLQHTSGLAAGAGCLHRAQDPWPPRGQRKLALSRNVFRIGSGDAMPASTIAGERIRTLA